MIVRAVALLMLARVAALLVVATPDMAPYLKIREV